jgi:hypothetical protein
MRTTPAHERAALHADAVSLRECAARLEALADELPADETGPDWTGILVLLAKRCRVTAEELEAAAALYGGNRGGRTAPGSEPNRAGDAARERAAAALAFTDRLLRLSAVANPRTAEAVLGYLARAVPFQTGPRPPTGRRPAEGR